MTTQAQEILEAARALPPYEQLELLEGLAQSLAQTLSPFSQATNEFWAHRSLEDIEAEQRTPVVTDIFTLAMPEWPRDETADDLIGYIRDQRRADAEH